jgi:hypothetical protein
VLGNTGVRPGGLESLSPGRVLPLGMWQQSNPRFLNCTKGDLCDPSIGSTWFVLEIRFELLLLPVSEHLT